MIDQAAEAAQQPQNWMQLVYMTVIVIAAQVPLWIREINKFKEFKKKNGTLESIEKLADESRNGINTIKADVGKLKNGQTKLSRDMAAQVKVCQSISGPLAKQVQENKKEILGIIKERGKE
jgi:hypothetical protein